MATRRKDAKGRVLKDGESERQKGGYQYRWTTPDGKRHYAYAQTLSELRKKEEDIQSDKHDGIRTDAQNVRINDIYDIWLLLKKGLKDNTFQNYKYMYEQYVQSNFGNMRITKLRKSDIRRFYISLMDERNLSVSTIDSVHTVLHQVLDIAVEDNYIRYNPSDEALNELKKVSNSESTKRKALTLDEQQLFTDFLERNRTYSRWRPIFMFLLGTGLRVGEATGLRWEDVDFEEGTIEVNHTLVYYRHSNGKSSFAVNTPKSRAGNRTIQMLDSVREALLKEKEYQDLLDVKSTSIIDGYHDFVFVNRFGNVQHQGTLNKALKRIVRDCNQEQLDKANGKKNVLLLPRISCHILRHTFTTRLCEANVNIKVIQDALGHSDISTTLGIYADVTKDLKRQEFEAFEDFLRKQNNKEAV